jgi:hypothetical protein
VWVHLSRHLIDDDHVWPASRTDIYSSFGNAEARDAAIRMGQYNPGLVSVMCVDSTAHIGSFTFCGDDPYCYEVEPEGPEYPDPDPDRSALPNFRCFRSARIIRLLFGPGSDAA